jgi:hypothetical protein
MAAAGPTISPVVDLYEKMRDLGIKFDTARICQEHKEIESFEGAIASAIKGQRAIQVVGDLIQRALAQPQWPANVHYQWQPGAWDRLCGGSDGLIDWIEYFEKELKVATWRFNCDLSNDMRCIGCWFWAAPRSARDLIVLADAILNNTTPDLSEYSVEEGILFQEALAFHRGEEFSPGSDSDSEDDVDECV